MFLKVTSYQDYCLVYTSYLAINQLALPAPSEDILPVWLQEMQRPPDLKGSPGGFWIGLQANIPTLLAKRLGLLKYSGMCVFEVFSGGDLCCGVDIQACC